MLPTAPRITYPNGTLCVGRQYREDWVAKYPESVPRRERADPVGRCPTSSHCPLLLSLSLPLSRIRSLHYKLMMEARARSGRRSGCQRNGRMERTKREGGGSERGHSSPSANPAALSPKTEGRGRGGRGRGRGDPWPPPTLSHVVHL